MSRILFYQNHLKNLEELLSCIVYCVNTVCYANMCIGPTQLLAIMCYLHNDVRI